MLLSLNSCQVSRRGPGSTFDRFYAGLPRGRCSSRKPIVARRRAEGGTSGFTLLEMVAVIGIVAALSAIVVGFGRHAIEASQIARAQTELAALVTALEEYQRICGDYPRTNDDARLLQALVGRRGPGDEEIAIPSLIEVARFAVEREGDPMIDPTAALLDPWGRRYRYAYKTESPWTNPGYVLYSTGPDGRESPDLLAGGFVNRAPVENTDNVYANQGQ